MPTKVMQFKRLQLGRGFAASGALESRPAGAGGAAGRDLGAAAGVELGNNQDQKLLVC
jgi:hypothetical protein